jgi:hypothetical protein
VPDDEDEEVTADDELETELALTLDDAGAVVPPPVPESSLQASQPNASEMHESAKSLMTRIVAARRCVDHAAGNDAST